MPLIFLGIIVVLIGLYVIEVYNSLLVTKVRIKAAKKSDYLDQLTLEYNTKITTFPTSLIARIFGFNPI